MMDVRNLPIVTRGLLCRKNTRESTNTFQLVYKCIKSISNISRFKINKTFAHNRGSFIIIYLSDKEVFISVKAAISGFS